MLTAFGTAVALGIILCLIAATRRNPGATTSFH